MRHRHRQPAAVDGDQIRHHPAAEGALIDEAQRGAVVENGGDPQMAGVGDRPQQHLAAHTEMNDEGAFCPSPSIRFSHRYFPRRPVPVIRLSSRRAVRVRRARLMSAHRPRVVDPQRGDGLAGDVRLQAAPHHLDFRELRHPDRRRISSPAASSCGIASSAVHAFAAAASVSAAFLERPRPTAERLTVDENHRGEPAVGSGPRR